MNIDNDPIARGLVQPHLYFSSSVSNSGREYERMLDNAYFQGVSTAELGEAVKDCLMRDLAEVNCLGGSKGILTLRDWAERLGQSWSEDELILIGHGYQAMLAKEKSEQVVWETEDQEFQNILDRLVSTSVLVMELSDGSKVLSTRSGLEVVLRSDGNMDVVGNELERKLSAFLSNSTLLERLGDGEDLYLSPSGVPIVVMGDYLLTLDEFEKL